MHIIKSSAASFYSIIFTNGYKWEFRILTERERENPNILKGDISSRTDRSVIQGQFLPCLKEKNPPPLGPQDLDSPLTSEWNFSSVATFKT